MARHERHIHQQPMHQKTFIYYISIEVTKHIRKTLKY